MKGCPYGALGRRDDLNPHPGKTDGDQSKVIRCNARKVNNSSFYEGTAVIDPNNDMCPSVYSRHTDHCSERQIPMSCGEFV
jgi:hypothetical protein